MGNGERWKEGEFWNRINIWKEGIIQAEFFGSVALSLKAGHSWYYIRFMSSMFQEWYAKAF